MKYLIKYSPEMTIKSRPVRNRFARQLGKNLTLLLGRLSEEFQVRVTWDYIEIDGPENQPQLQKQAEQVLASTQGICFFERVRHYTFQQLEDILAHTLSVFGDRLAGLTFAVRCKRVGKHSFNSMDVERFVGGGLNQNTDAAGVNLGHPQVLVKLEVRDNDLYVVEENIGGLNGFPLGTQDGVLSLVSGGFDSAVATYLAMKRGLITHLCFFNLGGHAHEIAVKEVALYMWMRFGSTHPVKFITVPFEGVVGEILENVDNSQMGVILKRMMLRAAERVAKNIRVEALVTGESVAQVSSQTLPNLSVIDKVTDMLVLRPLAMMEKQDIVDMARAIGTEEFSAVIPEYCGVISIKPTTRARMHRIEREESRFDFSVLDEAIAGAVSVSIDRIEQDLQKEAPALRIVSAPATAEIIVDIRHPDEEELQPLDVSANPIEKIPFYKLNSVFAGLPKDNQYLLYCAKGLMSKLHASYLSDQGYANVGVYRPEENT